MAQAHVSTPKLDLAHLRHEILTPINNIIGLSEMLLDELDPLGFSVHQNLTRIRETGRELLRRVDRALPARSKRLRHASVDQAIESLREELAGPAHSILQTVGAITSEEGSIPGLEDIIAIGRAAAELLEFAEGRRSLESADRPGNGHNKSTAKLKTEPARILVVDDNATSREITVRLLKKQNHRVTAVSSGAEALAVMLQSTQDLVLLDMLMPKLNGFQVLERIKADPSLKETPVIVISALNEIPGVVRCLEIGAEDYLFKPFDPVLLGARIHSSLEKKRLHDRERSRAADLENAFERLHVSEQRLRLALAAARAAIWDWDPATNAFIELPAPGAEDSKETEWTFDQIIQRIHPDDRERIRASLLESVQARRDFREEYRVIAPDGSILWFEALGTLQRETEGRGPRMIGVILNVTERRRADEALRRSNRDFQRFAMAASHDLQEPLRAVATMLEGTLKRLGGEDERVVQSAVDSLGRMSKLISDLLDYSQMSGKKVHMQPVSSDAVLALVLNDLKPAIEDSGARIDHSRLPMVLADFMLLHRIFQNLVANSIKYRGKAAPRIQISAHRKGDWWTFSVADNGMGIDPKYKDAVFGLFRRLHGSDVPGSGLGLAICHRIVEQFGGKIWMESAVGRGSTFFFTVPALPPK
jgi:signal transduction histidine kinase/FixJ family two-component response regulator